jgi:hypothetical protein
MPTANTAKCEKSSIHQIFVAGLKAVISPLRRT